MTIAISRTLALRFVDHPNAAREPRRAEFPLLLRRSVTHRVPTRPYRQHDDLNDRRVLVLVRAARRIVEHTRGEPRGPRRRLGRPRHAVRPEVVGVDRQLLSGRPGWQGSSPWATAGRPMERLWSRDPRRAAGCIRPCVRRSTEIGSRRVLISPLGALLARSRARESARRRTGNRPGSGALVGNGRVRETGEVR